MAETETVKCFKCDEMSLCRCKLSLYTTILLLKIFNVSNILDVNWASKYNAVIQKYGIILLN